MADSLKALEHCLICRQYQRGVQRGLMFLKFHRNQNQMDHWMNEGKFKDDVQEPNKTDMIKVEDDSKVKSKVESGVSKPKSASDVIVDVSHEEEGSDETDDKEPHDERTKKSIAAKVYDNISAEVMCNANAVNLHCYKKYMNHGVRKNPLTPIH